MKKTNRYTVAKRRRHECLTNYDKRLSMLQSGLKRVVIRKSNKHILGQIIQYDKKGDITLSRAKTNELAKYGYKQSTSNLTAAYLCGLLLGKKSAALNKEELIVDVGLQPPIKGSKIFAFVAGMIDAGMKVRASKEALPDIRRISGLHIKEYAAKLKKENQEKYKKLFSNMIKNNIDPELIDKDFETVKQKITGAK